MAIKRAREGALREGITNIAIKRKASLFFISEGRGGKKSRQSERRNGRFSEAGRSRQIGKSGRLCLCLCLSTSVCVSCVISNQSVKYGCTDASRPRRESERSADDSFSIVGDANWATRSHKASRASRASKLSVTILNPVFCVHFFGGALASLSLLFYWINWAQGPFFCLFSSHLYLYFFL